MALDGPIGGSVAQADGTMSGKVVVVTGANTGIGKATAAGLAGMGARVLACGRNRQKLDAAVAEIRQATGNPAVEPLVADLASMQQVIGLADAIAAATDRLDVLINNAGVFLDRRVETADGYDLTFAVNHLAPFALTTRLLPLLKASAPARIVTVSSALHARVGALDVAALAAGGGSAAYGQSKLCNVLFTRALARRLAGSGVTANCLHPGVIATEIGDDGDLRGVMGFFWRLIKAFMPGPAKGARTSIHLATSPAVADVSGEYFDKCKPAKSSGLSKDAALADALWAESEARLAAALGG